MADQRKYIILSDGQKEYAVIFDRTLSHVDVARGIASESVFSKWSKVLGWLAPVAAGFVYPDGSVPATTSESLHLGPRPQDEALLRGEAVPAAALPLPTPPSKPLRSLLERSKGARGR